MTTTLRVLTGAVLLVVAGCAPPPADYTRAEAESKLRLTDASRTVSVSFAPGSAHLGYSQAVHLARLAADGAISSRDRVTVAAAGSPALAERRAAAIRSALLRYGVVAESRPPVAVAHNHATITVERYLVTLPPCPNWSKPASSDFANTLMSNYGCATAVNLGMMAASPADLASGRPLGPADGVVSAAAVQRYHADKVKELPTSNLSPITVTQSPGSGGSP